jgi:hypothetical protein
MIIDLSRKYKSNVVDLELSKIDTRIFTEKCVGDCFAASCSDACCMCGIPVSISKIARINTYKDELQDHMKVSAGSLFDPEVYRTFDYVSGYQRTLIKNDRCIFKKPEARGCYLHSFALYKNLDYHILKPWECYLFPLVIYRGILMGPAGYEDADVTDERDKTRIDEKKIECNYDHCSVYDSRNDELEYLFGNEIIIELNQLLMPRNVIRL